MKLLLKRTGWIPGHPQKDLWGDKTTAYGAANTGIAYKTAMWLALQILVGVCQKARVRCWLIYLWSKDNRIADLASRVDRGGAENVVRKAGWDPKCTDLCETMHKWEKKIGR